MSHLSARELAFLHESNAIEAITNIDYTDPALAREGAGHVGAFLEATYKGRNREPLTVSDLCRWQGWLAEEQVRFGHAIPDGAIGRLRSPEAPFNVRVGNHVAPPFDEVPFLAENWLHDLNTTLAAHPERTVDPVTMADLLGTFFQRYEAIHPFADGNGRSGRLVAAYIATYCGWPIIVFRSQERAPYYAAHASKMAMRAFMADKLREAVYNWEGRLLERFESSPMSDRYRDDLGGELIVEWHDLVKAQDDWKAAAAAKAASRA